MNTTKPFDISKKLVWEAYKRVKANKGAAGIDGETILEFEKNLKGNLYKLWNRMSSGSYFPPPVLLVEIPKSDGKKRQLGIPTVTDRIAQMVAKIHLEPSVEPHFHEDSYGYRPNKSALQAIGITRQRCWRYNWVVDLDIQGFFDNLDHELLMKALKKHTDCKWILMYVERWLKAPLEVAKEQIQQRTKGTPQGGVISPLLANLFLHYAFDKWIGLKFPNNPFARYADDIIIHCKTLAEACSLKAIIEKRLEDCRLNVHPEKTKIVYCKDELRKQDFPNNEFDFLGYTFRPRISRNSKGRYFVNFIPAISKRATKSIMQTMREWKLQTQCYKSLEDIAECINPILRGWYNYYGQYRKGEVHRIFSHLNLRLAKWARGKYKKLKGHPTRSGHWLGKVAKRQSNLFVHWQLGIRPSAGR